MKTVIRLDKQIYQAALFCEISYSMDVDEVKSGFKALGAELLNRFTIDKDRDDDYESVVNIVGDKLGNVWVVHQGTRVTENTSLDQLWRDVDFRPRKTDFGMAARGVYDSLERVWNKIAPFLNGESVIVTGHSLGGNAAQLAPALYNLCKGVISFGAPMGASKEYWDHIYPKTPLLRLVCENDFAPGWPWFDGLDYDLCPPSREFYWFDGREWKFTTSRGIMNLSISAHSLEDSYIPALKPFSQEMVK